MITSDLKLVKPGEVRVRVAPSPTGPLHIGTARTALFNYLFAQKNQGSFILRIEDTDLERSDPKWEKDLIENLKWLGIEWSEGPDINGDYGPYRQSARLGTYTKYLKKLLEEKRAYYCFCSEEELEAQRQYQMSIGQAPRYNRKCAKLSEKETKKCLSEGKPSIIRFRVSEKKVKFNDLIRGQIEFDSDLIGDIAIAKNLTTPLYNFAVVVDDFEMKISHVIRGEDHISNTPKQILLQEALGFPQPKYGHLPLILGSDRSKLSKRHGAISIREYRRDGYLPETLVNFMALLGWNPGGDREIFSMNSLIKEFSLDKVQKSGAIFNLKRLDFLNGFYIRQKSQDRLAKLCLPYLVKEKLITPVLNKTKIVRLYKNSETGEEIPSDYFKKIVAIYQTRLKKLSEISGFTDFFFQDKLKYDKNLLNWKKASDETTSNSLDRLEEILSKIKLENWTKENLENILLLEAEREGDRGNLLWPFRVALSGKEASAGPFEIAEILGKDKVLKRIKKAKEIIKKG